MKRFAIPAMASLLLSSAGLAAGSGGAEPVETAEPDLEVVVVMGEQPGPGLWKVTSSNYNELWILGEVSPFTRRVRWRPKEFDTLLHDSQELLLDFSGYWEADKSDMATYRRAEKLPKGTTLKDVISPELHARVEATAKIFGATELEELYPFAAANRIVKSALQSLDMSAFSARFAAEVMAKKWNVRTTYYWAPEPTVEDRLHTWQQPPNVACLAQLVDVLEDGGDGVKLLANAWAVGDIEGMRELVPRYSFSRDGFRTGKCAAAMRGGEQQARDYTVLRQQGWVNEAERVLKVNRRTVAVVLMSELLAPDGYLALLRARGYQITEPH
jgi:uncharacterized protein YbaP (TraB family)